MREVRFLNVARAIETFHRKRSISKFHDKKLDLVVKEMINTVPEVYKKKFNDKLNHIQEPTLRDRVTELYDRLSSKTKIQLKFDNDWIAHFTNSRNYYTHFGNKKKMVLEGEALQKLSNRIRALLYVLVMKELGVKETILSENVYRLILV